MMSRAEGKTTFLYSVLGNENLEVLLQNEVIA